MSDQEQSADNSAPLSRQTSQQQSAAGATSNSSNRFRFSFRKKTQKSAVVKRDSEDLTMKCSFITRSQTEQLFAELTGELGMTLEQLLEHGGLSAALAFTRIYPREALARAGAALVCCGPGDNGGYGAGVRQGYKLTLFYPKTPSKPAYRQLLNQCEKLDIPFLSYMPGDVQVLQHNYGLIIDALFGWTFQLPVKPDLAGVFGKLCDTTVPIVSIDVPSGWEADKPPSGSQQLRPDSLISLFLPKRCSLEFAVRRHYLAGRIIPVSMATKLGLRLPCWGSADSSSLTLALIDPSAAAGDSECLQSVSYRRADSLVDYMPGGTAAADAAAAAAVTAAAANSEPLLLMPQLPPPSPLLQQTPMPAPRRQEKSWPQCTASKRMHKSKTCKVDGLI
uniref:NAD(P)H-hydrate epimerase n=1 Tax=Macrostomum lignano TaxID=282301 RepID=A0A1I8IX35_9PLAT